MKVKFLLKYLSKLTKFSLNSLSSTNMTLFLLLGKQVFYYFVAISRRGFLYDDRGAQLLEKPSLS